MTTSDAMNLAAVLLVAAAVRSCWPNAWTRLGFLATVVGLGGYVVLQHGDELSHRVAEASGGAIVLPTPVALFQPAASEHVWPPVVGEPYPDLQLIDQTGRRTALSEFKGKVILVEPVGMPCPACVAFAGGHARGPFQGVAPQPDLKSIATYAQLHGRVSLKHKDLVVVQVLFFNQSMGAPTPDDARAWADHFGLERERNEVVLAGERYLVQSKTREMIPGFQLIDRNFVLRYDAGGNNAPHNLFQDLLPSIPRLLNAPSAEALTPR